MKKDLVIGAVTGYSFKDIAPWVNSLDKSGFDGIKALIAYNMSKETAQELSDRGYVVIGFVKDEQGNIIYPKENFSIVVERFLHYYLVLDTPDNRHSIRYVLATDVRDVIFQSNPSEFFDSIQSLPQNDLVASSEELCYDQEPWGRNNLTRAFGTALFEKHKHNTIYNAGVIAAKFDVFMGLCKTVYLTSSSTHPFVPGGGGPDQAAYNLTLSTAAYDKITFRADHMCQWAAQLGTVMDPQKIDGFLPNLQTPPPTLNDRGEVINPLGFLYTIVHQWDRVPEVKAAVERRFL